MKRTWFILVAGIIAACAAYFCSYYAGTSHRHHLESTQEPELAWLKQEFQLSDAEFARIRQMHESYLAGCADRCRLIDEKNSELKRLLAVTNQVTPQIQAALAESARLRAECQRQMLQHFFQVSQTMPPEQGRRYLAWVQEQTILSDTHSQMHASDHNHAEVHNH
jgi:outer membrane murein-binding lipoprotein Lpp